MSNYDVNVVSICRTELNKKVKDNIDMIISVGGDGTLLRVSHYAKKTPIMAVNSLPEESEGVLTNYTTDTFSKGFKELIEGKARVIELTRLSVKIDDKKPSYALNEVFVGNKKPYLTARYNIVFKNNKENQKSSGVIICTGAGSSAWYKSAGGKSFDKTAKKARFIVREPYYGRLTKPIITSGEIKKDEKLIINSEMFGGCVVMDSLEEHDLEPGSKVEIKVSNNPLKVIVHGNG